MSYYSNAFVFLLTLYNENEKLEVSHTSQEVAVKHKKDNHRPTLLENQNKIEIQF